ncbi:glycosyltransferase family 2 protein [Luteolibacter yonseiensis]|uniref:Glycosyltransferase family 2 protein n=1 Tax=Luteolibacter yonseiensis TaxID=1144680 RepID=A0A934V6D4_9BACT|nr:glycosyltransferase family 2 protein [Luteolibacter yonseiensis]MBK1814912.1 glycosyltransferase family 2 protein [Luteolibacter yonseiensis]
MNPPTSAPQFGIVIPTYNRPELMLKATSAVLAQTHTNWTLVIVNDASATSYVDAVTRLEDPRIVYLEREQNGGCNAARNTGIDELMRRGVDYLLSSGDDEELDPRCLEVAAQKIREHPEYDWFMSNTYGDEKPSSRRIKEEGPYDWFDDYLYGKTLRGDKTHVIRATTLGTIRYDGRYRSSNMWPLFIPLAAKARLWAYPFPSKKISYLADGITKNSSRYPKTMLEVYSRVAKHAFAITHRPLKLQAYKYLLVELLKTPKRIWILRRMKSRPASSK